MLSFSRVRPLLDAFVCVFAFALGEAEFVDGCTCSCAVVVFHRDSFWARVSSRTSVSRTDRSSFGSSSSETLVVLVGVLVVVLVGRVVVVVVPP